jgi:hypothetical protein
LMAPKWIDFGSPKMGRGVNTVVVDGHVLRKNQLGNIEFGIISDLMPPQLPWWINNAVEFAYMYFPGLPTSTFWAQHDHSENYGEFKGLFRADNLAAFGVGHAISADLKKNAAGTLRAIQAQARQGKFMKLTGKERNDLTAAVAASLKRLFSNDEALAQSVNTYSALLRKKLGGGEVKIPIEALFFVPEYGGFNTDSLTPSKEDYTGMLTSREYFEKELQPAYDQYKKDLRDRAYDIDQWLRKYHEDYSKYEQLKWK